MTKIQIKTIASIDVLVEAVCDWAEKATPGECSIGMAERLAAASRSIAWKYKESVEADRKAKAFDAELKELMRE